MAALVLSQSGSYQVTFVVLAVQMALTVIDTVRLPDDAGDMFPGRRAEISVTQSI